ncbi:TM2 domain protein [Corynebacterium faecale]|nr:TM2 domain protein [Corynebacterium faecale]
MGTPFYQPDNGADDQAANTYPHVGNAPPPQWAQPPAQPQWGGGYEAQSYNVPQHHGASMPQFQQYQPQPQQKSMILAALLALFLGNLGVHNFYLGYTRAGLMQVGLTVAGWVLSIVLIGFLFLFVVGAWALIDFFRILLRSGRLKFDSRGVPLL